MTRVTNAVDPGPRPVDRATVLREAADAVARFTGNDLDANAKMLRRLAGEAPQPETQADGTARLARVVHWAACEVITAKTEFGNGYRAAQSDIRDIIAEGAQR